VRGIDKCQNDFMVIESDVVDPIDNRIVDRRRMVPPVVEWSARLVAVDVGAIAQVAQRPRGINARRLERFAD
jgi:hypothetical protein